MRRLNNVGRAGVTVISSALAAVTMLGCPEVVRNTELEPEGPPLILQVFVRERVMNPDDGTIGPGLRIAFGDHPDVAEDDDHAVTAAIAGTDQRIRIVVDELLLGNTLEEVECTAPDTWSQVPVGTNPDDIKNCIGADLSRCESVCKDQGGVLDVNGDRSLDNTRLIAGTVTISCGGIAVPVDPEASFYNPSGNQLVPAGALGFDGLGPAVVVVPAESLPTGTECTLGIGEAVVDKQDERPCTPTAAGECTPGDMSGLRFTTEPFQVVSSEPAAGAMDVAVVETGGTDAKVTIDFNGWLDPATVATGVVLSAGGTPVAGATVAVLTVVHDDGTEELVPHSVRITVPGGLQPGRRRRRARTACQDR